MYNSLAASCLDSSRWDVKYLFKSWKAFSHSSSHLSIYAFLMVLKSGLHQSVEREKKQLSETGLNRESILVIFSNNLGLRTMYSTSFSGFHPFSSVGVSFWIPSSWSACCGCYLVADLSFWTLIASTGVNDFFFDSFNICNVHCRDTT